MVGFEKGLKKRFFQIPRIVVLRMCTFVCVSNLILCI